MANPSTEPVMKLTTSMADKLRFRSLSAVEEMGRLFEFNVLALADADAEVDPAGLLGTNASVSIELGDGSRRHFHGVVARAGLETAVGSLIGWRLVLRPWLWALTRRSDCRIFQNMSVPDILKKVFSPYAGAVNFDLKGSFEPREYCVQYRETDFNFASRLMEEEGIYYFFRHTEDRHTLHVCNAMTSHEEFPEFGQLKFRATQDQLLELKAITDWRHAQELNTGKVSLTDYDFIKPGVSLMSNANTTQSTSRQPYEHYDYPGRFTEASRGGSLSRVRMQEFDARVLRIAGYTTTINGIAAGHRFKLEDHPLASENTDHVVLATRIDAQYAGYESGTGETRFSCRFEAMRYAHVFRPDRSTPKPVVGGPQTAVVVGRKGEEIWTDQYGRVKLQFHWDREGKSNESSSCWVRVASPWAGKAWGMIQLPRIGQEVVVDFLEGDPDRPLVTGRVYNATQLVPYKLPDHQTVSTVKSQSSKGGTTDNANELRFEDDKGKEYIWFQAERDFDHLVKHDSRTWIKGNESRLVGGNLTEKVGGKHQFKVGSDYKQAVTGNHETEIGGNAYVGVAGPTTFWGNDISVDGGVLTVGVDSLDFGADQPIKITSKAEMNLKAPMIKITADVQLSLKVGGNFVDINPAGVFINGTMVMINSGGSAAAASEAANATPSAPPEPEDPAQPKDPLTANS